MSPKYDELSNTYADPRACFVKVDTGKTHDISAKFSVRGLPTFKTLVNTKEVDSVQGADLKGLEKMIKKHLGLLPPRVPRTFVPGQVYEIEDIDDWNEVTSQSKYVIVEYYADWCGPCKMIAPKFAEYAESFQGAVFVKTNLDDSTIPPAALIESLPSFQVYENKRIVDEFRGAVPTKLQKMVEKWGATKTDAENSDSTIEVSAPVEVK
ncbi:hypothetical protein HK098_006345 [Nowakowskiella sp. JEL0407]|nr:hypothetical protein HK098_006345 [Nowakowskiella sp. JEL0407]